MHTICGTLQRLWGQTIILLWHAHYLMYPWMVWLFPWERPWAHNSLPSIFVCVWGWGGTHLIASGASFDTQLSMVTPAVHSLLVTREIDEVSEKLLAHRALEAARVPRLVGAKPLCNHVHPSW